MSKIVPLVLNQAELIGALEREKMINYKHVILEKLKEELQGIDNSLYTEMNVYFYVKKDGDKTFHFIFANIPHKQCKVTGNPRNAIITVEFLGLEVYE